MFATDTICLAKNDSFFSSSSTNTVSWRWPEHSWRFRNRRGALGCMCADRSNVCNLAPIGRPDVLPSVITLARSVKEWNEACDNRWLGLVNCFDQSKDCKQYCHVGNTIADRERGLFQDASFADNMRDSKSTSGGVLCVFGSYTFVQFHGCARSNPQCPTTVPKPCYRMQDLRMAGLPALQFGECVFGTLACSKDRSNFDSGRSGRDRYSPTHPTDWNFWGKWWRSCLTFPSIRVEQNFHYSIQCTTGSN